MFKIMYRPVLVVSVSVAGLLVLHPALLLVLGRVLVGNNDV